MASRHLFLLPPVLIEVVHDVVVMLISTDTADCCTTDFAEKFSCPCRPTGREGGAGPAVLRTDCGQVDTQERQKMVKIKAMAAMSSCPRLPPNLH